MTTLKDLSINDRYVYEIMKNMVVETVKWRFPIDTNVQRAYDLYWETSIINGRMMMGKVVFPDIRWFGGWHMWPTIHFDSLLIHHLFDDDYCLENRNIIENLNSEGAYLTENCMVNKNDVVIDAGAYIGDWSAVASVMGGKVYAFDPCSSYSAILDIVAKYNNFTVVKTALGDTNEEVTLYNCGPGSERIYLGKGKPTGTERINVTTLDDFAINNDLKSVDFIKADIEGYENNLLVGAKRVIKEFHPKLSIRTYHNQGDKETLTKTILDIEPDYKIEYGRHTLYAHI